MRGTHREVGNWPGMRRGTVGAIQLLEPMRTPQLLPKLQNSELTDGQNHVCDEWRSVLTSLRHLGLERTCSTPSPARTP